MKYVSHVLAQASGTMAGTVAANNRGGLYMRSWRKPVNPRTVSQENVRAALGSLSSAWRGLTAIQQGAWKVYGQNTNATNALGKAIVLTGNQWYVGCNTLRLQAGLARVDDGPGTFGKDSFTAPTYAITSLSDSVDVTFDNTDAWANEDGGGLLIFASRPVSGSINFFGGPFDFVGVILGNAMTAPTSPATMTLPIPAGIAGTQTFFRAVSTRADGRFGPTFRSAGLV